MHSFLAHSFPLIPDSLTFLYCSLSLQQDRWHPLLNTVTNVQKYRWLKHSVQGTFFQCSLMATIVEFALKEEPLDVEKMRKCLLKQVTSPLSVSALSVLSLYSKTYERCLWLQLERAEVRLEGIETMLRLASKSFLLPSVQYAMLCGWQRVIPERTSIGYVRMFELLR